MKSKILALAIPAYIFTIGVQEVCARSMWVQVSTKTARKSEDPKSSSVTEIDVSNLERYNGKIFFYSRIKIYYDNSYRYTRPALGAWAIDCKNQVFWSNPSGKGRSRDSEGWWNRQGPGISDDFWEAIYSPELPPLAEGIYQVLCK